MRASASASASRGTGPPPPPPPPAFALPPPPFSFLFVVNELLFDLEKLRHRRPIVDQWSNTIPPAHHSAYMGEIPSVVMRYRNGNVSEAGGYQWVRTRRGDSAFPLGEGCVVKVPAAAAKRNGKKGDDDAAAGRTEAIKYKAFSIFSCNPLLPIVIIEGDPTSDPNPRQHPLLFFHPQSPHLKGLSQAVTEDSPMERSNGGVVKFVAGSSPSWIPALVPETYRNPERNAPLSRGLAGELPVVIGLMAFSEPRGGSVGALGNRVRETFLGDGVRPGKWRGGRWHASAAPQGYPLSTRDDPRGFLVVVFLDPENVKGSTKELLHQMEWFGVIVRESWTWMP